MVLFSIVATVVAAPQLVDAARFEGALLAASANDGLFRVLDDGTLDPVDLGLSGGERRIRAVEADGDLLWLGTDAGLILIGRDMCGIAVHRRSDVPVAALASGPGGLAVAAADGVYVLDGTTERWRVGRSFNLVTWWLGRVVAAGAGGVFVVQPDGAQPLWHETTTAISADGERLLVGGADGAVHALAADRGAKVVAVVDAPVTVLWCHQDAVWIGAAGVPLLRVPEREVAERLLVGTTVRALVAAVDHVVALTDDGLATVADERGVAYQYALDDSEALPL